MAEMAEPVQPAGGVDRRPLARAHTEGSRGGMRDDPSVSGLVLRARIGDQDAWNRLVERYTPMLWSTCRRHRLGPEDAVDVVQRVWLLLVEQLPALREPAALPGWLLTTTRRECLRLLRASRRH